MLTIVGDRWTELLRDGQWWRRAWAASWQFAPRCFVPAVLLTAANLTAAVGGQYVIDRLKHNQSGEIIDIGPLLLLYLGILGGTLLVLALSFIALGQWLFKLTAFARLFYEAQQGAAGASCQPPVVLDGQAIMDVEAVVWKRWVYIMKVWAVASIVVLPPFLPLAAIIMLHSMIAGPMPVDIKLLGWPMWLASVGSSRVDLQACKLEYSIVSPK